MAPEIVLGTLSAIAVLALISAAVSLWLHLRSGSVHSLESKVNQVTLDLHDLFDTVEKWTRRDRVRRLRDGREEAGQVVAVPQRGTPEYKSFLRRKIMKPGA